MDDAKHASPDDHVLEVQRLFLRHQAQVLAYVLSIEPNYADAQDIVQEVFLTVTRKARTFELGTNFLAWACTIARYETLQSQRTRARRAARLDEDVLDLLYGEEPVPPGAAEALQRDLANLRRCLDGLSRRARELMELRYHRGLKPQQIAEEIRWGANAVRVALSRARAALRQCMKNQAA